MRRQSVDDEAILHEARRIAAELEARWPGIETSVSCETQSQADAHIWIANTAGRENEIRWDVADLIADVSERFDILARLVA
jgi:hypothetical protein